MMRLRSQEWKTTGVYLGRLKQCILLCVWLVVLPAQSTTCNSTGTRIVCEGGYSYIPSEKIPKTVTELDISRNKLEIIDESTLRHFSEIRELNMSRNLITNIHSKAFFFLTSMETLDLSFNCLKEIHDNILYNNVKLRWFSIAHNVDLKYIPQLQSKSLVRFNVSNCSIQSMNETTFQEVESIRALDLSFNELTEVPHHTFDALTALNFLDVSNNKLLHVDFINSDCALSLAYLDISSNHISDLDLRTFETLISLRTVHFQNNPWNCNENMKTVYENMLREELTLNLKCISPVDHKAISWHEWYYTIKTSDSVLGAEIEQSTCSNSTMPSIPTTPNICEKTCLNCSALSYVVLTISLINITVTATLLGCYIKHKDK